MGDHTFTGSTAVITGGSRGIGAAIGHALALAGARVVLTARDKDALDRQMETITAAGGQASGVVGDTTDPEAVRRTREHAENTFGPVDLLVVNAGGGGRPSPLADLDPGTWQQAIDLNLTAPYLVLREFVPPMMERGQGAVVSMSSIAGSTVTPASTAYSAAKAGLEMVVRKALPRPRRTACGSTPSRRARWTPATAGSPRRPGTHWLTAPVGPAGNGRRRRRRRRLPARAGSRLGDGAHD